MAKRKKCAQVLPSHEIFQKHKQIEIKLILPQFTTRPWNAETTFSMEPQKAQKKLEFLYRNNQWQLHRKQAIDYTKLNKNWHELYTIIRLDNNSLINILNTCMS